MLQKNPMTMRGTINRCWLFTYQTPAADAQAELPASLEAVTHGGYAFWNIVVCHISAMRPRLCPAFVGIGYWYVAYRLYVRFHPAGGAPVEGLYFLRSDCDNRLIAAAGKLLTDFNFHIAGVQVQDREKDIRIDIQSADAPAQAHLLPRTPPTLPAGSAFGSIDEAAAFLKYKPFGISVDAAGEANIVKIVRDEAAWQSRLVTVQDAHWAFMKGRAIEPVICYQVKPIVYQWNRGYTVPAAA